MKKERKRIRKKNKERKNEWMNELTNGKEKVRKVLHITLVNFKYCLTVKIS